MIDLVGYAVGYPQRTDLFGDDRDTPGLILAGSRGLIPKLAVETGLIYGRVLSTHGMCGGPVVSSNGDAMGMVCSENTDGSESQSGVFIDSAKA